MHLRTTAGFARFRRQVMRVVMPPAKAMKLTHHELQLELDADWWIEAGMIGFVPAERSYRVDLNAFPNRRVYEVRIDEVGPVHRNQDVGIFNDNDEATARERVLSILQGCRSGAAFPPIEVVKGRLNYEYAYKLVHGTHRFYCSLAAGFTHVPAVDGFDITTLYQ